ncbi:hypothetical protein [Flavicella sp.]|uniref:hypothetical protein n=1 Tax=Flavicella sp. TaxID=2957742 RepID=UPI00301756CF
MNKIEESVKKIIPEIDKLQHLYLWSLAFFIGVIGMLFLSLLFDSVTKNTVMLSVYIITLFTAGRKEFFDWYRGTGKPEFLDFFFSVLIPSLCMLVYYFDFIISILFSVFKE